LSGCRAAQLIYPSYADDGSLGVAALIEGASIAPPFSAFA
jgi:hypothetical protein